VIVLLQRVSEARVDLPDECIASIGKGILAMVGVQASDDEVTAQQMVSRILNYRVFADAEDKMNLSLIDINGGLLLVPQFTLAANTRKGRRPSFTSTASPAIAQSVFQAMLKFARACYEIVECGRFGANMQVQLINDGPVTFILD
jgi:D-tyrosyl-tRNA(Tyr) deacylase